MDAPDRPWTTLVDAEVALAHRGDPSILLLDCRHDLLVPDAGRNAYLENHIPGAVHAHCDRDLAGPVHVDRRTGRHPLPEPGTFRTTCGRWGITPDTQVIAYDDSGGPYAARAWWLLRHYGHDAVAVLDGGIKAYVDAGGELTDQIPVRQPMDFLGAPGHLPTVDAGSLLARVPVANGVLLDARDPPRYRGEMEPIDPVAGHIPGAVGAPYKDNLDPEGRFLAPDELEARFLRILEGHHPEEAAVYCGSGVTAVHNLLAMEVAGLSGAALFPGSWSEWVSDPSRPVERSLA